jgi:hypothetical protein
MTIEGKEGKNCDKLVRTGIFTRKNDFWSSVKMYISIDDKEVHHQRESYFCFIEILFGAM